MKKLCSIILTLTILTTLIIASVVPVFAFDYSVDSVDGEYFFKVNNGKGLKYVLEEYSNSSDPVHVILMNDYITLEPTVISKGGRIFIEAADPNDSYSSIIKNASTEASLITIEGDDAENTILSFNNVTIVSSDIDDDGAAIRIEEDGCVIGGGHFKNCSANGEGIVFVNGDHSFILNCDFFECNTGEGGILHFNALSSMFCDQLAGDCSFIDCKGGKENIDIYGRGKREVQIAGITTNNDSDKAKFQCHALIDKDWNTYKLELADKFFAIKEKEPAIAPYSQPNMSDYARETMAQNKYCDVIRPYISDEVTSELGYFTLNGTTDYGMGWMIDYEHPLTITAEEGYTITRIDAILTGGEENYEKLIVDAGTKCKLYDNPYDFSNSIAKEQIVQIDDINSDSVTLTVNGSLNNYGTMRISDIIIYFEEESAQDTLLGSVLSGGNLAIVTAVAGLAIGLAVGLVVKRKPAIENAASLEKIEEEDE